MGRREAPLGLKQAGTASALCCPIQIQVFIRAWGFQWSADLREGADLTLKSWQRSGGNFCLFVCFSLLLGLLRCQLHSLQLAAAAAVPDMAGIGGGRASSKAAAGPDDRRCTTWSRESLLRGGLPREDHGYQTQHVIN